MSNTIATEVFIYELQSGAAQSYEEHHAAVWPEVIASIRAEGIVDYAIYRRGDLLISVLSRDSTRARPETCSHHDRAEEWANVVDPLLSKSSDELGRPLFAKKIFDLADYPAALRERADQEGMNA